jgi:carbon storage regulator
MLSLTRRLGQSILVGDDIRVLVTNLTSGRVELTFEAPDVVRLLREEVLERVTPNGHSANGRNGQAKHRKPWGG